MPDTSAGIGYQLFRLVRRPDQCCAVLEGNELPNFLDRNEWATAELLEAGARRPPGFQEEVAVYACATQGFYVFTWSGKRQGREQANSTDVQSPSLLSQRHNDPGNSSSPHASNQDFVNSHSHVSLRAHLGSLDS